MQSGDDCVAPPLAAQPLSSPPLVHLVILALIPVVVLLLRRPPILPPNVLAVAVALVTPLLLLAPVAGMSLSVAINCLLLVHCQELQLRQSTQAVSSGAVDRKAGCPEAQAEANVGAGAFVAPKPFGHGSPSNRPRSPSTPDTPAARVTRATVPEPQLDVQEVEQLARGVTVLKQLPGSDGAREGLAAQRINAPAELVWQILLHFEAWPGVVDNVVGSEVYERDGDGQAGNIRVRVTLRIGFIKINTHVHHVLDMRAGQLTWSLDPRHPSDLLSNTGYWLVRSDPSLPNQCTVYYSAAVRLKAWAPAWLDAFIAVQGLPRAVGWIKRAAERRFAAQASSSKGLGAGSRIQSAPDLAGLEREAGNSKPNGAAGLGSGSESDAVPRDLSASRLSPAPGRSPRGAFEAPEPSTPGRVRLAPQSAAQPGGSPPTPTTAARQDMMGMLQMMGFEDRPPERLEWLASRRPAPAPAPAPAAPANGAHRMKKSSSMVAGVGGPARGSGGGMTRSHLGFEDEAGEAVGRSAEAATRGQAGEGNRRPAAPAPPSKVGVLRPSLTSGRL